MYYCHTAFNVYRRIANHCMESKVNIIDLLASNLYILVHVRGGATALKKSSIYGTPGWFRYWEKSHIEESTKDTNDWYWDMIEFLILIN